MVIDGDFNEMETSIKWQKKVDAFLFKTVIMNGSCSMDLIYENRQKLSIPYQTQSKFANKYRGHWNNYYGELDDIVFCPKLSTQKSGAKIFENVAQGNFSYFGPRSACVIRIIKTMERERIDISNFAKKKIQELRKYASNKKRRLAQSSGTSVLLETVESAAFEFQGSQQEYPLTTAFMAEFEKNFRRKSQVVLSYLCIVNALTYMVTTKIYSALPGQCILGLALTQLGKKSMFELTSHTGISTTYYKARKDFEKLEKENPIPDNLAAFACLRVGFHCHTFITMYI